MTHQRVAVLNAVLDSEGHPTADGVYQALRRKFPSLSRATVYKSLLTLSELGVISRIAPPGIDRAAARFDPRTGPHHHALCAACGRLIDVEEEQVGPVRLPRLPGFRVDRCTVNLHGTCSTCADHIQGEKGEKR